MSLFFPVTVACPKCGRAIAFQACSSVNADRRPDLRDDILAESFQRETCPDCATTFRLEPELTYTDVARNQWIAVFPIARLGEWEALEQEARATFADAYGENASAAAQEIGADLQPRLVFGWAAFREKIAAKDAGLGDVTLELTKMTLWGGLEKPPLAMQAALRYVEPTPTEELVFISVKSDSDEVLEALTVPRSLYDEITADEEAWRELRTEVSAGYFVDALRLIAATASPG